MQRDTHTHTSVQTHTHTNRVMLHSKFSNYLQRCTVCSASFLGFCSCLEAALPPTVHHHTHASSSLRRSCHGSFFFFAFAQNSHTSAGVLSSPKTKSCTVRRCQRRAPTHPAPSENPANAAAANCAVVKGTALQ